MKNLQVDTFTSSHGKQPRNWIGGTVKSLIAKASLQQFTSTYKILIYVPQDQGQETTKLLKCNADVLIIDKNLAVVGQVRR